jgi:hypothetical protein
VLYRNLEAATKRGKEIPMMFRTFVRPMLVALSLAFASTAAAPAFADGADAKAADHKEKGHKKGDKKHDKKDRPSFPVTADNFTKMVDGRLSKVKTKLESGLEKHKVEAAAKTKILKDFDDGAALVRTAVKRVGKDGEVTKDEAKEVRELVKSLRTQMRAKYAPKKADKAAAKDV